VHLPEAGDERRRLPEVARPLRGGHDHGAAAVGHEAAVEEPERVVDHLRALVVLERDRLTLLGERVRPRVLPPRDRDVAVLRARDPVLVHLAARDVAHER
jgi:hypothetical protein